MSTETNSNPELSALRNQVFILLIALIVISGTLTVYLYRQASITRKDIEAIQPQAQQVIGAFNQNQKLMMDFVTALVAYGKTHPDFMPVLAKNGMVAPAGAPAPATPAAPGAPVLPKK
jgi:cytochrome c biogenesis factor